MTDIDQVKSGTKPLAYYDRSRDLWCVQWVDPTGRPMTACLGSMSAETVASGCQAATIAAQELGVERWNIQVYTRTRGYYYPYAPPKKGGAA